MAPKDILILSIMIIIILSTASFFYFQEKYFEKDISRNPPQSSGVTSKGRTTPSQPDPCSLIQDTYVQPDFGKLKEHLANENLVKALPKSCSISLRFFHFTEGCRKWDKYYLLSEGQIKESQSSADIIVWVDSSYVEKFDGTNLCDIFKEARNAQNLGMSTELSKTQLLWRYKSMLGYADCLGLEI